MRVSDERLGIYIHDAEIDGLVELASCLRELLRLRADNARLQKIAEATANLIPRLMDPLPMRNMVSSQTIDAIEQYEQALAGEETK